MTYATKEDNAIEDRIVGISFIPVRATMKAPLPTGRGGAISYSNHEMGMEGVKLDVPLTFVLGDEESMTAVARQMAEIASVVSEAVQIAFFAQLDRLDGEMKARGGYRAKVQTPDTL